MRRPFTGKTFASFALAVLAVISGCSGGPDAALNTPILGERNTLFAPMPAGYHGCPDDTHGGAAYTAAFKGASSSFRCNAALPSHVILLVIADEAQGGRTGRAGQTWQTAEACTAGRYPGTARSIEVPPDVQAHLASLGGADVQAAISSYTYKEQHQYVALVCFGSVSSGYLDLDALAPTSAGATTALPDLWATAKQLRVGSYLRTSAPGFPATGAGTGLPSPSSGEPLSASATAAPAPARPVVSFGSNTPVAIPYVGNQPVTYRDVQTLMHDIDIAISNLDAEDLWYAGIDPASQYAQNLIHDEFSYFQQLQQHDQYAKFYEHVFAEKDVQFDATSPNIVRILAEECTSSYFTMGSPFPTFSEYTLTLGATDASFPNGSTMRVLGIQNVGVQPSTSDAWYRGWPH